MTRSGIILVAALLLWNEAYAQRDVRTHTRSMLRQTIYNTGELGRPLEGSNSTQVGIDEGTSALEWPPAGRQKLDGVDYFGHQNSQGGGLVLRALVNGFYETRACGGVSDLNGDQVAVAGVYVLPGPVTRTENYPLLANGDLNLSYDPNEAEEIIVARYSTIPPMRLNITQTSRAWSYPGYDAFIITEYEITNADTVDYTEGFVMFQTAFSPSAFGLMRKYGVWNESATTSRSREQYSRYNFSRFLTYVHSRDGFPDTAPVTGSPYFNTWSAPGDRGGLTAPQAVGYFPLHYDYDHLQHRSAVVYAVSDSGRVWDANGKFKQPYTTEASGNRNQDLQRTINLGLTLSVHNQTAYNNRSTSATPSLDSTNWANEFAPYKRPAWSPELTNTAVNQEFTDYWHGRMKPRSYSTSGYTQAFYRYMSFGPYLFPKGQPLRFAIAHVVGYGPGSARDTVWRDAGGRAIATNTNWFSPVPSWHDELTYDGLSSVSGVTTMGSTYLRSHEVPWYVTGGRGISTADTVPVLSIRDAADRAIQTFTGRPLVKYDGVQFKPESTASTGTYGSIDIPMPAPVIEVLDAADMKNRIVWGPQVEGFRSASHMQPAVAAGRVNAGVSHYLVFKAPEALGPWSRLDSVTVRDPRIFNVDPQYPNRYVVRDNSSLLSENYYYCVLTVDSLGGRSGYTNITYHSTQKGAVARLGGKLYVAPNPLILSSPFGGGTLLGDKNDRIGFYGLPQRSRIRVFSYSGQLIGTVEHDSNVYSHEWFQISRNNQRIAAGVYFFTVEDLNDGTLAHGKFVIIH
jgi:hypothetical protein